MSAKSLDEEGLFNAARRIAGIEARALFLSQACGDNAALAERVQALLKMHEQEPDSLDQPRNQTVTYEPIAERVGMKIGPYILREQIGEGGFGLVFVAEQTEPVKRKVALKVIKPGMDSQQVIARFEAERQALALMDHPNIARVLDAGATDTGRPYFVMELVRGIPITEYCDQNQLSPKERLELFMTVCQAIQHAHQKGIIHRDIKPSNVLVTSHDGKPVAKVIDFGIAKAINQHLTERTIYTNFAQMVGTPLYMSPEQAEMSGLDIDTRSDIYSLGVLLYELLTGTTPLEKKRFAQAAYDEIRRIIREEEPPKPSTRISESKDALPSIAARRHTEPAKLSKLVRGDLDWITMKALEKDRTRRYETANGLARDIQRYLCDEPVEACPPSASYRLRKFAKKNRAALTTAAAIALLLILAVAVSAWQAIRATQAKLDALAAAQAEKSAKDAEVVQRQKAQAAAEAEKQANAQAQKRLAQVEKGIEILASVFTDLHPRAEEKEGKTLRVLLGERVDEAAAQLTGESVGDPVAVARLQLMLGQSQRGLGYPEKAIALATRARATLTAHLGPDHPDTLRSMNSLASGYHDAGKLDLALPLWEETLKLQKAKLGADHPDTLTSMNNLAEGYSAAGKLDLALPLWEETLRLRKDRLGADHPDTFTSMNSLAMGYYAVGKLDLALPLWEETLKLQKAKLGADHLDTLTSMNGLAMGYYAVGKLDLALPLWEETLKLQKAKLGADHPSTLQSMNDLAVGYDAAGKPDLAVPLYEKILKLRQAKLGSDHPDTLNSMNNLAAGYFAVGKLDLALPLLEETLKLQKAKLGADHPRTLHSMNNLAAGYQDARKLDLALPLYEETLKLRQTKLGSDHPDTLMSMNNLAEGYRAAGKLDLALPLFQAAAAGMEQRRFQHEYALRTVNNLSDCYERLRQFDRAEAWRRKRMAVVKERSGAGSLLYAGELAALGFNLLQQKKWTEAEAVARESLVIREQKQPDVWTTFNTKSTLGEALLGQKKYADAEPLLLAGYEGMKQRSDKIPAQAKVRLTEAVERLVQLYEASGKPDEATKWRKELETVKAAAEPPAKQ